MTEDKFIDINRILEHIGALGKWQWIQGFFLLLIGALAGVSAVVFAITGFVPKHRCQIPSCENSSSTFDKYGDIFPNEGKSCGLPELENFENCQQSLEFILNGTEWIDCPLENLIFDKSVVTSSITEDFKMVCQDSYLRPIYSSLFSFGRLLGSFFIGIVSDHIGRIKAITLSILLVCLSGIGETLVSNRVALAIFRTIYGMGGNGCILATFVLAAESTLPKFSVLVTTIPGIGFHFGELILAVQAYFLRDWKTLQLSLHIPALLFITFYFALPESVRWLNAKGKVEKIKTILNKRASVNKKVISEDYFKPIERPASKNLGLKDSLFQILSHKKLCRQSFNCFFQCFCGFFGYYGTLYTATTLSGDPHINFMLAMICGIPGTFLYLLLPDRIGRKATVILAEVALALSCVTGSFLQYYQLYPVCQIICSMISRLVAGVTVKATLLLITELFPTPIRNTAMSIGGVFGGIGSILGLLMEVLEIYWKPLPVLIVGVTNIFGAILVLQLPETKGRVLPETFDDVMKTVE